MPWWAGCSPPAYKTRVNEFDRRFEELRRLGLSEQQIIEAVNREIAGLMQRPSATGEQNEGIEATADAYIVRGSSSDELEAVPEPESEQLESSELAISGESSAKKRTRPVQVLTENDENSERLTVSVESFSGQYPHPAHLEVYEKFCPGFLRNEQQRNIRVVEVEADALERDDKLSTRGQIFAGALTVLVLLTGILFAYLEAAGLGAGIICTCIVGLATVFVLGRKLSPKGLQQVSPKGLNPDPTEET